MKFAYFPGCSLHSTAKEYDMSTREVAQLLGVELQEIPDWACCGASPAHSTLQLLSIALPVRTLLLAGDTGATEVVTCCAACFSRLKFANNDVRENAELRAKISEVVGREYLGAMEILHFLEVLTNRVGMEAISGKVERKLSGLKVACYYGCLLTRPQEVIGFDDPEDPHLMDDLMHVLGAEAVDWPYKIECCGTSFSLTDTDIVLRLCNDILQMARDEGAEAIVVACPLCQSNLDMRQRAIEKKYRKKFDMPIIYFTQLVGLALGIGAKEFGLKKHIVDPMGLLRKKGLV